LRLSLFPIAVLSLAAAAQGAVVNVIADTDMFATNYTGVALFNAFSASAPTAVSSGSGGNPTDHRILGATLANPGFAYIHEWNTFTYDPSVSGAINSIDWRIDGSSASAAQIGFLVRQNNNTYFHLGHFPLTASYLTDTIIGSLVNQFNLNFINGINPDFSAIGAPIQFGYFAGVSNFGAQGLTPQVRLDNFCVAVNNDGGGGGSGGDCADVPEPGTFAILGFSLAAAGIIRRRRQIS